MLEVKVHVKNEGTSAETYFLATFDDEDSCIPLRFAPYWKTRKGAVRWAEKHGYKVVE